jgi:uncharacterized protein YceH (UPF0502 family)
MTLDPVQLRVLGSLIEKEITTPENYPLSLNALIAACNQRSSRDPVLDLTEDEVRQALHALEERDIVAPVRDARVPKYEHRLRTVLNLRRDEIAVLCLLLLRGPQTPGELRARADRLYSFDGIAQVQSTLERLAAVPGSDPDPTRPLTVLLPRQPGARESRFAHLLGDQPDPGSSGQTASVRTVAVESAAHPGELDATLLAEFEARLEATIEAKIEAQYGARLAQLTASMHALQTRIDLLEASPSSAADERPHPR